MNIMSEIRKIVWLSHIIHTELKIEAAKRGVSMGQCINQLLIPVKANARTQKIITQKTPILTQNPVQHKIPSTLEKTYKIGQNLVAKFNHVSRKEIDSAICQVAGADPRTIRQYFNLLVDEKVLVAGHKEGKLQVWKVNHVGGWLPYHLKDYSKDHM